MKLWQQGALILGVPLLFQSIFAVLLILELMHLEHAAQKETQAKIILYTCEDAQLAFAKFVAFQATMRYMPQLSLDESQKRMRTAVGSAMERLKILTADDPATADLCASYSRDVQRFDELVDYADVTLSRSKAKSVLVRFLNDSDYLEELSLQSSKITNDLELIKQRMGPTALELTPESSLRRQQTINLVIMAILANFIVVIIVAASLGRSIVKRMDTLMDNMKLFARGNTSLASLSGNDEIALLDREFRTMAEARMRAEELRKTILEMVTHDLRSPLSSNSITLSMFLEEEGEALSAGGIRKIRRVNSEMARLVRLADSLLEVGKIEGGHIDLQLGWHELDHLIMTALHAVRGMSDIKGIGFDAQFEPKVKVWCDAGRIIQVLINLLSNAIKVSPNESTIVLKAMFAGNGAFRFEILDAGPGIAEDQKDKLFQKFSQLSDPGAAPGSGKGLGLYICRQLVGAHGGEIGISASGASGSCFWFEIPQVQTDAAGAQTT